MASNLNKPTDFLSGAFHSEPSRSTPFLIPPSEFEKPTAKQVQGHRKLQNEKELIQNLQQENDKLKFMLFQSHGQHESFTSPHNEYADELIKHQAGEIKELKNDLLKCRQGYSQELQEWERKVELLEDRHKLEVKNLEKQLEKQEEDFELRYSRLSSELQRTLEESNLESLHLREMLEKNKSTLSLRTQELEEAMIHSEKKLIHQETELRNKSKLIEDQALQLTQLKTYFGETEMSHKPAQLWKVEKETMENRLKIAQAENQKIISELELLEVRFKALSDILTIQESELSKSKTEGLNSSSKQHNLLLTRWREKVFALIVQQKSGEMVYKNDINKCKQTIVKLEEKLKSCEANGEVLKLSLMEKGAQLQMETNNSERLQAELDQLTKVAMKYDDETKENYNCMRILADFIKRHHQKYEEKMKTLEDKSKLLKILCQRVSFASSRMDVLKAQLTRKAAIDISHNKEATIPVMLQANERTPRHSDSHLENELERVMKERDLLANQVMEDSRKWTEKILEIKNQHMNEVSLLKKTVEELEATIATKSQQCSDLTEELESLHEDLVHKNEMLQQTQSEIQKYEKGIESVLAEQRLKDEEIWNKKLSELEHKLNDAKREHAKTVVSLRQMERNHTRELSRNQELLQTTEDHFNRQLLHTQNEMIKVEKERNIMLAILKQEGLIHALKTERGEPYKLDETVAPFEDARKENLTQNSEHLNADDCIREESHNNLPGSSIGKEHVQDVLEELKSLTADLLNDESDEEIDQL
ncbi:coiled-coil alpha-helical rod protein 1 [Biomphalaria pfeifferi]|uniref:Coiled-coil alpha-helical rod protein 1 n=1 Tax=Biomphalaria pfeifferi TaxID=112525 RepID=A0AAD8FBE7_BIOPF|nr:coiled-coil alpha-helical rod protein 1 [Biomphalaria pfeifferi]